MGIKWTEPQRAVGVKAAAAALPLSAWIIARQIAAPSRKKG